MVNSGLEAVIVRVCNTKLKPLLGTTLAQSLETLKTLHGQEYIHCCGEGGEFETFVTDSPLFSQRIEITEREIVAEDDRPCSYRGRLNIKAKLVTK